MKIAAPFPFKEERQEIIDEYNITFDCEKHQIKNLVEWLEKHQEKRINIKIMGTPESKVHPLDVLMGIKHFPHIVLRLAVNQGEWLNMLQENGVPFFFDYDYNINSFCRLEDALEMGVSDVYILEDLCYRLPQVRDLCSLYGVQIRLVPNSISSFTTKRGTDVTSPWYVPENYNKLSLYYDVFEFELFDSWNRFDTLYKIWCVNREWKDDLKFINFELEMNIPGDSFASEVCEYKMTCGHRCLERQGPCRKCHQMVDMAKIIEEKRLENLEDDKWVENNEDEIIKSILE